jgi:hypothetical protein
VATTSHPDTDVDLGEGVLAAAGSVGKGLLEEKDGLVDLVTECLGFDEVDGLAVDADETFALLGCQTFVSYTSQRSETSI